MRRLRGALVALPFLVACQGLTSSVRPPLGADGEVYLYLQPHPQESGRLSFTLEAASVLQSDGAAVPLTVASEDPIVVGPGDQRLLAWGRLSPGSYGRMAIRVKKATVSRLEGTADLLVDNRPPEVTAQFTVTRGRATVVWLKLEIARSLPSEATFNPVFSSLPPDPQVPGLTAWASSPDAGTLTVFNKHTRQVTGVLEIAGDPYGVALDDISLRGYVALNGRDEVAVLDLLTGMQLLPIRLRPGDRPTDLGMTPDRQTLISLNTGSASASFLDPATTLETSRVQTGYEPSYLLIDRSGKRAYVCNRMSSSITVLDVANRATVGLIATEASPVAVQLNRDGTKLFVVHSGSPFLTVYAVPSYTLLGRYFIGLGAASLKIDPLTDLVYLGRTGSDHIDVYEPTTLLLVGAAAVSGGVTYSAIDDVENALIVLVPERSQVAAVDLASRKVLATLDSAGVPFRVALIGERH